MLRAISARHFFTCPTSVRRGVACIVANKVQGRTSASVHSPHRVRRGGGRRGISGVTDGSSWIVVRLAAAVVIRV